MIVWFAAGVVVVGGLVCMGVGWLESRYNPEIRVRPVKSRYDWTF